MKLTLKNFQENPSAFMRSRGYAFDKKTGDEFSFVRRITGQDFPRFHAYVKTVIISDKTVVAKDCFAPRGGARNDRSGVIASPEGAKQSRQDLIINLHLDQKRPSYDAGPAHGGEYGGKLIKQELERIENYYV